MSTATGEYVEERNGGYYVTGTRVSLDSVVSGFRRGESPETIFQNFPAVGSLAKVYGAIAFALDHPQKIEAYLASRDRKWEAGRQRNPSQIVDKVRRARRDGRIRSQ